MNNTPEDLRLVMVDPKMVELVRFNGFTTPLWQSRKRGLERILGVLRWTVCRDGSSLQIIRKLLVHANINTYNRKMRRRKGGEPLPHIVVMIDELADLMMSAPDQNRAYSRSLGSNGTRYRNSSCYGDSKTQYGCCYWFNQS